MTALTHDTILVRGAGVVTISQPGKGARFTLDSLLLADFCRIKSRDRVLELGAGTGVISLLLAGKFPHARFVADENEPLAYDLLCRNIEMNRLRERIVPIDRDIRYLNRSLGPATFDDIVANPPYTKSGTGKISPDTARRAARHDEGAELSAWLNVKSLLKNGGRYFLVFSAHRASEIQTLLSEKKMEPKRIRFVHPFLEKPASLVLIEAVASARPGVEILPPLVIHRKNGAYTDEMRLLYGLPHDCPVIE
jgi:tRNA1Val (adenine37-N6)-methyltransferase